MTVESLTTSETLPAHGEPAVGFLSRAAEEASRPVVAIRGVGLLTPLGETAEHTWDALLAGRYITDHARAAGEFDPSSPRVIQMARRVADQALAEAGWTPGDDFATVIGTSKGSVESWLTPLQYMAGLPCEAGGSEPVFPDVTGLGDIATSLGRRFGRGPKLTVSAACVSGLLAVIRGSLMVQSGEAERVLVVASEASVHPLFLSSFKRLGVLPKPEIGCRPFDETRDGFLMSEAAAAVCLEAASETHHRTDAQSWGQASAQPPRTGVAIDQFAFGADASHLTGSDPTGRVLTHLINKVTRSVPVDLVHAHGTGTVANDPTELTAIGSALAGASSTPCLYSHKAALGHSLGAAGLIAVVLNVLAHQRGVVPPNVRTTRPLPADAVTISTQAQHRPIRRSLALAAGFGGPTAALSLATI
jgi:3-oxoacyl-[acyl-carrier-protein] synthase II